jgi:threonine/homoserine/homoserine lactone efflux protein
MFGHILQVLPPFLLGCLVLAALPGPASVLCVHRTLRDGRTAGLAAVAGNELGVFSWAIAGGTGLSVLLAANRVLSDAIHIAGGLTLIMLGVQAWRGTRRPGLGEPDAMPAGNPLAGRTPGAAFRASLVSIAANPKAAVFAVSFFPEFLPPSGTIAPTLLALASIQVLVDSAWTTGLVLLAGRARALWRRTAVREPLERTLGAVLIALGLDLAIDRQ